MMETRLVVGIGNREVRSALFLALESLDPVRIVGSATSAAEVVSLCRSLRPSIAIVEEGLSDWDLRTLLDQLVVPMWEGQVVVLSPTSDVDMLDEYENVVMADTVGDLAPMLITPTG